MKTEFPCPRYVALALLLLVLGALVLSSGCASFFGGRAKHQRSSSVAAFLYPHRSQPLAEQGIPVLSLPLRIGVAFVPSTVAARGSYYSSPVNDLSEAQKQQLMQRVSAEFKALPFVQSIELVPSMYLRPGGGFENVDQLRSMLGIDVVALLAYDQIQFTDEDFLSLAYWTIVGAYLVQGNRNDTQTLMEAAIYDIPSRHLLFRAPGASQVKARSTPIGIERQLRADSASGFEQATAELIANLKTQLADFRERAKNAPDEVQIVRRPGYTGGGGIETGLAVALGLLALTRLSGKSLTGRARSLAPGWPERARESVLDEAAEFIHASQPGDRLPARGTRTETD
jgi:rhombotail lipoprotein